jgi:hypothetical protein
LANAGWFRAGAINAAVEVVLHVGNKMHTLPVITASNSGGSMFAVRYLVLRALPTYYKWTYPCYLLPASLATVCFFHSPFGAVSGECAAERFNVVSMATSTVFAGVIANYGGPLGAASSMVSVWGPFLSDLVLPVSNFMGFWMMTTHYMEPFATLATWLVAYTLVSPEAAQDSKFNYGWDSFLPRCFSPLLPGGKPREDVANMSVTSVVSISANTLTGFSMMPTALSAQGWSISGPSAPMLKIMAVSLSYIMTKRLMSSHQILYITFEAGQCMTGACPAMDGTYTDNGPLTPTLSFASRGPALSRVTHVAMSGPTATFAQMKYLLGQGPLGVYTAQGGNNCPFTEPAICMMLGEVRALVVSNLPREEWKDYEDLASVYQVWRPEAQVIAPFCGNPVLIDEMEGQCKSMGFCSATMVVVPSKIADIAITPDPYRCIISAVFLSPSPLAARFVRQYIPIELYRIRYFSNMENWFPDFSLTAPEKGGVAFNFPAGHSLLDYVTFLAQRLILEELEMDMEANDLVEGKTPACGLHGFYEVSEENNVVAGSLQH